MKPENKLEWKKLAVIYIWMNLALYIPFIEGFLLLLIFICIFSSTLWMNDNGSNYKEFINND